MSTFKDLFSNVLLALVLVMGAALFLGSRMLESRGKALSTANETINTLQQTNEQQVSQLATLQRDAVGLRKLLGTQNAALAELDQQHRKTADDLQEALSTPPVGRPDCAREPLPGSALRLLKSAPAHRGDHSGDQAPATGGAGAALPGA